MKTINYAFIGMLSVLMGWTLKDTFMRKKIHLCLNCNAKGFSPLKTVRVQEEPRKITSEEKFESIDPEKIKNLLSIQSDNKSKFQTKILIIGLAIATIGIIFGSVIQGWIEKIMMG